MNTHQRLSLSIVWATGFIVAWAVASMEARADILRDDASAVDAADGSTWDHAEGESITVELALTVTMEDDYSFPQAGEYDYGVEPGDIEFSDDNPAPGDSVTITAHVHNNALCRARSVWGWYSPTGRSCWGEWDFDYTEPTRSLVDISYRCRDNVAVHWRVELDGVELASPTVPGVGDGDHWKIVTIHDVPITEGTHTIFLGTYQMDHYPDYEVDWIEIGDVRIEAENYDRMGGNDPNPDYRGLSIRPKGANPPTAANRTVQIWNGDPAAGGVLLLEDFVGPTNEVIDSGHDYPGYTYTAHYIENNGVGTVGVDWTPDGPGTYDIYVIVDPNEALTEIDEGNNVAQQTITVGASESEFFPTDDAYIAMNYPSSNYGSSTRLCVMNRIGHPSHPEYWERDALMKFDLSAVPAGTDISSATLHLYYYEWTMNDPAGRELSCNRILGDWEESSVTWDSQPGHDPVATSIAIVPDSEGIWMEWDVAADVQAFLDGTVENYGWQIVDEQPWGWYNIPLIQFRSKEFGDFTPYLSITVSGGCPGAVTISDAEFDDADWVATAYSVWGGASHTVGQHATGGNPGSYRYMTHVMPEPSGITVFHEYIAASYDPAVHGAIAHVVYSEDRIEIDPPWPGAQIGGSPALSQNGVIYVGPYSAFENEAWETVNMSQLMAEDFVSVDTGDHPDFSATGGVIHFGYRRANSHLSEWTCITHHGIDNWSVTICPAGPTGEDCNENGIPDDEDLAVGGQYTYETGTLSPFRDDSPADVVLPGAPPATGDVAVMAWASADLDGSSEYVDVFLDGNPVGQLFYGFGRQCPSGRDQDYLMIPAATYNAAVPAGISITLAPTAAVGTCSGAVEVRVTYPAGSTDCNGNGVPDECDIADETSLDCNDNGVADECESEGCSFPTMLSENTTGSDDLLFIGPPDDFCLGVGGQRVTYEFDCGFVVDGPGPDFNVYEYDTGGPEFDKIDVMVSSNGVDFVSVKSSEGPMVSIGGDEAHSDGAFARSYDLSVAGLFGVRYICIDGNGSGSAGPYTDFDLDAIGAINLVGLDCNENGIPDDCDIADGTSQDVNGNGIPDECEIIPLDIKPGSCPNPLNRNSHGVLPVALAGTGDFDTTLIDVSSVRLVRADGIGGEVAPNEGPPGPHSVFADVATPFGGEPCDCHYLAGDGITDLSMKFRTDDVVEILELDDLSSGDEVELIITGLLTDGTEFTSSGDCILIVPLGISNLIVTSNIPELFVEVTPANLCSPDDSGFADFQRQYTSGTVVTLTAPVTVNDLVFSGWEIDGAPVPSVSGSTSVMLMESYTTAEAIYQGSSAAGLPAGPAPSDEGAPIDVEPMPDERPLGGVEYDPSEDARKAVR